MEIETLVVHKGRGVDPSTRAVTPPLYMSTTFERDPDGSYPQGYVYGRTDNPNRRLLEELVAAMENGEDAAAFSSGMAAIMSVFQALRPGDHVIAPRDIYHGAARLLRDLMARWGLGASFVDMAKPGAVESAVQDSTRIVFLETPSNPLLTITDLAAVSQIARERGIYTVCDNTWATPALQRPLELGVDLVVHSSTKYLGGHGDVTGGVVVAARSTGLFERVRQVQQDGGAVPSPFDCWLLLRSIRTLPYRVRAHTKNAAQVAKFLAGHPRVEQAFYPGLTEHPGHDTARRQMEDFGGMLSFRPKGGREAAFAVAARTRLFTRATSLGSYESLIEHRASVEGPESATPQDLLRVSVGLENSEDLVADLAQALDG
ncbi:MAG: PLP-dependent transferase [Alphaproteobacteria bacterium]|nr:PLP-dependent transferase [Alphaproteobacteria bacterium]